MASTHTLCVFTFACAIVSLYTLQPDIVPPHADFERELQDVFSKAKLEPRETVTTMSVSQCCRETLDCILSSCNCHHGEVLVSEIISCLATLERPHLCALTTTKDVVMAEIQRLCAIAVDARRNFRRSMAKEEKEVSHLRSSLEQADAAERLLHQPQTAAGLLDKALLDEEKVTMGIQSGFRVVNKQIVTARTTTKKVSLLRWTLTMLLWFLLVIILSTFSVLYGLGQSIPAKNSLGLDQALLNTMTGLAPLLLTIISGTLLPKLAQKMVTFQYGNHLSVHERCSHVVRLVLSGNIIIGFLVPLFVVIVVNEDCLKLWVEVWDACSDDSNFDEEYGKYRPSCFINCPSICRSELCC